MPDDAETIASFEALTSRLHPAVADVFRHLMDEVRAAREAVNLLTQRVEAMKPNLDRTISAAHRLTDVAEGVVKVLTDTAAINRQISDQLSGVLSQLDEANRKLADQAAQAKPGTDLPVVDNSAAEQAATDLRETQAQLDALTDEMEGKADKIGAAIAANTAAAKDGSAPQPAAAPLVPPAVPGPTGVGAAGVAAPGSSAPPGTASNQQTLDNLGNPAGPSSNAPAAGPEVVGGQQSGVPSSLTDQSAKAEPDVPPAKPDAEPAPPVAPPKSL